VDLRFGTVGQPVEEHGNLHRGRAPGGRQCSVAVADFSDRFGRGRYLHREFGVELLLKGPPELLGLQIRKVGFGALVRPEGDLAAAVAAL
jgi:hypothetical protein